MEEGMGQESRGSCTGGYRRCGVRRASLFAALGSLLALLLLNAASASALLQRGHVPAGSFGESGEASRSLPSAIAVNEATGDVYVLEKANSRVMVYGPAPGHGFIEAWGVGVKNGKEEFQQCPATQKCLPGIAGFGKEGQLDDPVAIAIDNASGSPSKGDVYVVANNTFHQATIDKFSPAGALVHRLALKNNEAEGPVDGVAIDAKGTVYVEREDEEEEFKIIRFSDAEKNKLLDESELEIPEELFEGSRPVRPGFAIDANDDVYITYEPGGEYAEEIEEEEEEIAEREKERKSKHEELKHELPREQLDGGCELHPCYVAKLSTVLAASGEEIEAAPLNPGVEDAASASGLAVDETTGGQASGDLYLDQKSVVSAFTPGGTLIQRLQEEELLNDGGGSGLTVDGATNEVLVADDAKGRVDVFAPALAGPPTVEAHSLLTASLTSSAAELKGEIDPDGGEVRYHFQYGASVCDASPATCAQGAVGTLGGFGAQPVELAVSELAPSTTYRFRLVVEDVAAGSTPVESEEATFTTQASSSEAALADGRSWELVTPSAKHGSVILPLQEEGGLIEAAADGGSLAYVTLGAGDGEPEGERGPEPTQWIATRKKVGSSGESTSWSSQDIATRNEAPAQGFDAGGPWEYQFFSNDLSSAFVDPYYPESPVLLGGATERTPYIRDNATCVKGEESTCFTPVVTPEDDTAEPEVSFGAFKDEQFETATPDMKHVVISSLVPLTSNTAKNDAQNSLYMLSPEAPSDERLQLISILPGAGEPQAAAGDSYVGGGAFFERRMAATAISTNGQRVVWAHKGEQGEVDHLYMRELAGEGKAAASYQVDQPDDSTAAPNACMEPAAEGKQGEPLFQTATADGSKVFFTDPQGLTEGAPTYEGATADPHYRELYVFEPEQPECDRVKDLAPSLEAGASAEIDGGVLGVGEDSESVTLYFVANGVLAPGAPKGNCHATEAASSLLRCDLYVVRYDKTSGEWGAPNFIRQLSNEDNPDWGSPKSAGNNTYSLKHQTARVSPNGRYLAFMSNQSLTGYDNTDANSGARDEEVYLYDNSTEKLVCASCNPDGAQPVGVFDEQYGSGEGVGLVVDRPQTWEPGEDLEGGSAGTAEGDDPWLAGSVPSWTLVGKNPAYNQSDFLSNEGRLFFNSADALTHVAKPTRSELIHGQEQTVGVENVYEYEQQGVGTCAEANTEGGCVSLISSGESEHESAFLDASENGEDVYFLTEQELVAQDTDTEFDIYDARDCKLAGAEPCATAPTPPGAPCAGEMCKPAAPAPPSFEAPASASAGGSGNITASHGVLSSKVVQKPKPKLTTAQLRAKALDACKKDKKKAKRVACEKQARKRYRVPAKKKGAKGSQASSSRKRKG
jgi:DNA-binding beta-propeller fold protein YncE